MRLYIIFLTYYTTGAILPCVIWKKTRHFRATIYPDSGLHRALRLKSAESSISVLVKNAVKSILAEDFEDLAAFEDRAQEPNMRFEDVPRDLRRRAEM